MTNRSYRLTIGLTLLLLLYFENRTGLMLLIAMTMLEGITNWRLPFVLHKLTQTPEKHEALLAPIMKPARFRFEAERAFRIWFASFLILYLLFPGPIWFLPWLMAFATIGAGISGVCPSLWILEWIGFAMPADDAVDDNPLV